MTVRSCYHQEVDSWREVTNRNPYKGKPILILRITDQYFSIDVTN